MAAQQGFVQLNKAAHHRKVVSILPQAWIVSPHRLSMAKVTSSPILSMSSPIQTAATSCHASYDASSTEP